MQSKTQNHEEILKNNYAKIWIDCKGVMHCQYLAETIDIAIAKVCVDLRLAATKGKSYCTLVNASSVKSITKEARDYLASEKGSKNIKGSALVIQSQVGKIMGNFFLVINKPKVPVKLFTSEDEALSWLHKIAC